MTNDFLALFQGKQIFVSKPDKEAGVPWHFHEDFETAESKLREREDFEWGTFFTVNELDRSLDPGTEDKPKKRTKKMFTRARAVWLDWDNPNKTPPLDQFPIPPSITVTTSPGKYHFYWLTSTTDQDEWNTVMDGIQKTYGGDNNAKDLARVLRLPGFKHNKNDPFDVTANISATIPYLWQVITTAFPPFIIETSSGAEWEQNNSDKPSGIKEESFSTVNAIKEILNATNYHGSLTSLAMRYVNKNMEREEILYVLKGLGAQANKREEWELRFSDNHLYECIDSAILKKIQEDSEGEAAVPDIEEYKENKIPKFPKDTIASWPEPWPMLWENYKKLPRTLDESLLVPTILTSQSFFLNSRYINEWGKRPNMAFLAVAPSTGNKDVNSKDVLETIRDIMIRREENFFFWTKLLSFPESITADTSFLQSFDDSGDLFWVNTEATHIFQQMAMAKSNASMKALEAKLIEVVDGGPIMGKQKAGEAVKTIEDPNVQVLLYAQPETIREYLQDSIIDSGLLGRFMLHIPEIDTDDPFVNAFIRRSDAQKDVGDEFSRFFSNQQPKSAKKIELRPDDKNLKELQNWMMTDIAKMVEGEQHVKMLRRLAVSAEQLYTVILGTMRHWDHINDQPLREAFDVDCIMPLLNYWAECKVYALDEYVDDSIDPLADHIYEIVAHLITGKIKSPKFAHVIKKYKAVPRTEIDRVIRSRKRLVKMLDARNDLKNVRMRTHSLMDMWVRNGTMVEIDHGRKKLIGFSKDHED